MATTFQVARTARLNLAHQDVQTQSVVTIGNATSFGGGTFGFRIEPRLVALGDPSNKKGRPEMKLDAKTYPALILLVMDKEDLTRKVSGTPENNDSVEGAFDHLVMHVESKWTPLKDPGKRNGRLSEQALMKRAIALDRAFEKYDKIEPLRAKVEDRLAPWTSIAKKDTLKRRHMTLSSMGLGTTVWQALPVFKEAKKTPSGKTYIDPESLTNVKGWLNGPSVFLIKGQRLAGRVKAVTVAGLPAEILQVTDGAIVIKFDGWPAKLTDENAKIEAPVLVATTTDVQSAGTVTLEYSATKPKFTAKPNPRVVIKRDDLGNVIELELIGDFGFHTAELAAQLKEILSKGGSGEFQMQFKGESSAGVSMSN